MEYSYTKKEVKTPSSLKEAMVFFSRHKISYDKLFEDYCDSRGITEKAFNLWADYKYSKGIPVSLGVAIDETAFERYVWKLRKLSPSLVISALFYGGSKNESAFECGFLLEESKRVNKNLVVINPSPYMIEEVESGTFLIENPYRELAYKSQFPQKDIYAYDEAVKQSQDTEVLAVVKSKSDFAPIYDALCGGADSAIVCIPKGLFISERESLLEELRDNGKRLSRVIFVNTSIFADKPKMRVVLYIDKGSNVSAVQAGFLDLVEGKMVLKQDYELLDMEYIRNGKMTYCDAQNRVKISHQVKKRNKPQTYKFSDEISISYKYTTRKEKTVAIASYSSYPDARGISHKLTKDIEKGLRVNDEIQLNDALEAISYDERLYPYIVADMKKAFHGRYYDLTLKTLWFIFREELIKLDGYDDDFCRSLFANKELLISGMKHSDFMDGNQNSQIRTYILKRSIDDQFKYTRQLNTIFSLLKERGIYLINPVSEISKAVYQRMEEEQYEVRNALTKKHFSLPEQTGLLSANSKRLNWMESRKYETFVIAFRLFSSIPIAEMLPLRWCDIEFVEEYGFCHVKITQKMDRLGNISVHAQKSDWKRFRLVPLPPELSSMAFRYKKYLMDRFHITSQKEMDEAPIFTEELSKTNKQWKLSTYDKINKICQKAIGDLNIPSLEVKLPGEKEVITDLNKYYSDIFLSNYRYYANHVCKMTKGEINYIMGVSAEDTFSAHYCDYTNDAVQYSMCLKLRRWTSKFWDETDSDDKRYARGSRTNIKALKTDDISVFINNTKGCDVQIIRHTGNEDG